VRDGWLHSGDLACRDGGSIWFRGRKKEIIIRGGSNVSPQEVEEALMQHAAVYQAGVVGVPDPEYGEAIVAFVSLRDSRTCSERELIDLAQAVLSDHKVPRQVRFVDQLPLGSTGKVSRRSLRQWVETGEADAQVSTGECR
jgi:acyl-CoA synthetase (AMP-forming)/AMP-acid ligase II